MKNPFRSFRWLAALLLLAAGNARAQYYSYSKLHTFSGPDGAGPEGALIQGGDGNFYGTTSGSYASTSNTADAATNGTVFRITPGGVLTTLHVFAGTDGAHPKAPLAQLSNGLLYGTTSGGFGGSGVTIFSMATDGSGFKTLIQGSAEEGLTEATLVKGSDGNLYGTDRQGGANGYGAIFQLTPAGVATILYSFRGYPDGEFPNGPLFQASDGNFYGCAGGGGAGMEGAIFRISPAGAYTLIYSLAPDGTDGSGPNGLVQASDGYLYGTCQQGGDESDPPDGTVFRVTLNGAFTKLFDAGAGFGDGDPPQAVDQVSALIVGPDGALYGTGKEGGETGTGYGAVYRVSLDGTYSPVYAFDGVAGAYPFAALVLGSDGALYGATAGTIAETDPTTGGDEYGTVFKITLSSHAPFFTGEAALGNGAYYLSFPNGNDFGYYSYLSDPHYIYHYDLGYEYVFDAADGNDGVYFYDFTSGSFFYTSPVFPFPYLYDFTLDSVLYYYPNPGEAGHYNTNGVRYFYDFNLDTIITQ